MTVSRSTYLTPPPQQRFPDLSAQDLADRCQNKQPDASHEPFCFELFRRAIAGRSSDAWANVYLCYQKLMHLWVVQCMASATEIAHDTADDLVLRAFSTFWQQYTADKLDRASELAQVLAYLKSCAVSQVNMARRRAQARIKQAEWDQLTIDQHVAAVTPALDRTEQAVMRTVEAQDVWSVVEEVCNSEQERIIARLSFVADVKPGEIVDRHANLFPSVEDVYRIRKALRNRLRRNPTLQAVWQNE